MAKANCLNPPIGMLPFRMSRHIGRVRFDSITEHPTS